MNRGTQIAYIPNHADGNIKHPSVEFGFVMRPASQGKYWCRFWRRGAPGELRTVLNSELTPKANIVEFVSVSQDTVDQAIKLIESVMR